jgi:hypothetical protein
MASVDKGLEEIPEGERRESSQKFTPPLAVRQAERTQADETWFGRSNRVQL